MRFVERELEPFGELGRLGCAALEVVDGDRGPAADRFGDESPRADGAPAPQVTSELGCTLTGPPGSTPVTVSSSDVQLIPTAEASARVAADVEVPGPRSRGSSETASPTVITLPSSACRSVVGVNRLGGQRRAAQRHRPGAVDGDRGRRSPRCRRAGRRWTASRRRAAPMLDRAVLAGQAGHRRRGARPGQRHRVPFPDPQGGNGIRVQSDDAAAGVDGGGVQPRGEW